MSLLVTYLLVPKHIEKLKNIDLLEMDVNKKEPTLVPGMGGLIILAGFTAGIFVSTYLSEGLDILKLLGAVSAILMLCLIGFADDVFRLSRKKLFLIPLPVLPLLASGIIDPAIKLPLPGHMEIAWAGWLFIPLFIVATTNFTNMFAGLNGLEVGTGAIMTFALLACALILGYSQTSVLLLAPLLGALLGFLPYNRYPAKVFAGDTGTYLIGGTIGIAAALGDLKIIAGILFLPHIIDAALKLSTGGIMQENSYHSPKFMDGDKITIKKEAMREYNSLLRVILSRKPMSEKGIVHLMWGVEGVLGVAAVLIYLV